MNQKQSSNDPTKATRREIDIIGVVRLLFAHKLFVLATALVMGTLGTIVALNNPRTWTTTVILAPETSNSSSLSSIAGAASMFGIKLGGGSGQSSDAIYPELYPEIFSSVDFQLSLFPVMVKAEGKKEKSYFHHLAEDGKIPFWQLPKIYLTELIKKPEKIGKEVPTSPFKLTKAEQEICKMVGTNVGCTVDKKTEVITISVTDEDAYVSACMADTILHRLQAYITDYRTSKARHDLQFLEELYKKSHTEYIASQKAYAKVADAYTDVTLKSVEAQITDLENEMQLKYNSFSRIAEQLQLAKQRVLEETPVFTIIQSAVVPVRPSSTPRLFILIGFLMLGLAFNIFWLLLRKKERPAASTLSDIEAAEA